MLPALAAIPVVGPVLKAVPGWVWKVTFLLAIIAGTYIVIRKFIRNARYSSAVNNYGSDSKRGLTIEFANDFYNAFFRLGSFWTWLPDGTDTDLCYDIAARMNANGITFGDVSREYKILFNRDLLADFNNELDNTERQRFNQILSSGLRGITYASNLLVSKTPTIVLNEMFQPVQEIPQGVKLGGHLETFLMADSRKFHGFQYNNRMRYVNADDINLIAI